MKSMFRCSAHFLHFKKGKDIKKVPRPLFKYKDTGTFTKKHDKNHSLGFIKTDFQPLKKYQKPHIHRFKLFFICEFVAEIFEPEVVATFSEA